MGLVVTVERDACAGYGNCVVAASAIFELDPDDNVAGVVEGAPVDEYEDAIREAELDCPARAILVSRKQ
ncbi:ferredoxin [Dactylosporangium sp. NPDC000555]|uniref:ferredoxin n=1 Tax=Dactylosporangium sp. NPDC000555 TaxID=3154260 RepID=UPI003331ACC5